MKTLKLLILCFAALLTTTAAMAQDKASRDLIINSDGSVILHGEAVKKENVATYMVDKPFSIQSIERKGENLAPEAITVLLNKDTVFNKTWKDSGSIPSTKVESGGLLTIEWGSTTVNIMVKKEEKYDLVIKNENQILLKDSTINKAEEEFIANASFDIKSIAVEGFKGNITITPPSGAVNTVRNKESFATIHVYEGEQITIAWDGNTVSIKVASPEEAKSFPYWIIAVIVLLIAAVGGFFIYRKKKNKENPTISKEEKDEKKEDQSDGQDVDIVKTTNDESGTTSDKTDNATVEEESNKVEKWESVLAYYAEKNGWTITDITTPEEAIAKIADLLKASEAKRKDNINDIKSALGIQGEVTDDIVNDCITKIKSLEPSKESKSEEKPASADTVVSKELIRESVKHTSEILSLFKKEATVLDLLRALDDRIVTSSASTEVSTEQLEYIVAHPNTDQIIKLKKYVRTWLQLKYNHGEIPATITDDFRNEKILIAGNTDDDTRIERIVLDRVAKAAGLDDIHSITELVNMIKQDKPDVDKLLIERLQQATGSKAQSISEIIAELSKDVNPADIRQKAVRAVAQSVGTAETSSPSVNNMIKAISESDTVEKLIAAMKGITPIVKEVEKEKKTCDDAKRKLSEAINKLVSSVDSTETTQQVASVEKLIAAIKKSQSIDAVANALKGIMSIADKVKKAKDDCNEAQKAMIELDEKHKQEIAEKVSLLKEKITALNAEADTSKIDSIDTGVSTLAQTAADIIKGKDSEISSLQGKITEKEGEIAEASKEIEARNEKLKSVCQDYASLIESYFGRIEKAVTVACEMDGIDEDLKERVDTMVIENDFCGLSNFVKQLKEITASASDYDATRQQLKKLFADALDGNGWIFYLAQLFLYSQHPDAASLLAQKKIDVASVAEAFTLTEAVLSMLGIKLSYPRLFSETYDASLYEEDTLSDVGNVIGDTNVKNIIGSRRGVIKDISEMGYTIVDGETHKAKVVKFN